MHSMLDLALLADMPELSALISQKQSTQPASDSDLKSSDSKRLHLVMLRRFHIPEMKQLAWRNNEQVRVDELLRSTGVRPFLESVCRLPRLSKVARVLPSGDAAVVSANPNVPPPQESAVELLVARSIPYLQRFMYHKHLDLYRRHAFYWQSQIAAMRCKETKQSKC
jgi:hypothetical protein